MIRIQLAPLSRTFVSEVCHVRKEANDNYSEVFGHSDAKVLEGNVLIFFPIFLASKLRTG